VIQGGDPTGTGYSGPGYEIVSEFSPKEYKTGTVGMASSGKDTEGSQWFITTGNYPHLDGSYSIFGEVTEGQDIADSIDQDDVIINIELNK
jgi:cyclophilin family peptidyl-prolyl cis-trans isomerase